MTDEELLFKAECLQQLQEIEKNATMYQCSSIDYPNRHTTSKVVRIWFSHGAGNRLQELADKIFRPALAQALEDYKVALRTEINRS